MGFRTPPERSLRSLCRDPRIANMDVIMWGRGCSGQHITLRIHDPSSWVVGVLFRLRTSSPSKSLAPTSAIAACSGFPFLVVGFRVFAERTEGEGVQGLWGLGSWDVSDAEYVALGTTGVSRSPNKETGLIKGNPHISLETGIREILRGRDRSI